MCLACDHKAYKTSSCVITFYHGHMSYNGHHRDFDNKVLDRQYFYCGNANGGRSLQNWRGSHRWSNKGDIDGTTLCVKKYHRPPTAMKKLFDANGYALYRVFVKDKINSENILEACKAKGMLPGMPAPHPAPPCVVSA